MKRAPPKDLPEATAEAGTLTFSLSARVVVEGSDFLLMATVYPSDMPPILARLEPSCEYMYKSSLLWNRGLGWRIHESVEVTKLSTNKQHTLSLVPYSNTQ